MTRSFATMRLLPALVAGLLGGCASIAPQTVAGDHAFVGVSVVTIDRGVVPDQTVVVDEGRIAHLGAAVDTVLADDVLRIEGQGRYLAPGLADMHVHVETEDEARLYLPYGVTTVRVMWGGPEILKLREKILGGQADGPSIVTAGPILDGSPAMWPGSEAAGTPEEAARIVSEQGKAGYDFVKVYSRLTPEAFAAATAKAQEIGIPVAGHVPDYVRIGDALAAGMASMEHLIGFDTETVAVGVDMGERRSPEQLAIGRRLASGELQYEDIFDSEKLEALAAEVAASNTWVTPTLMVLKNIYLPPEQKQEILSSPKMRYVSPASRAFWDPAADFRLSSLSKEDLAGLRALMALSRRRVKVLHDAGVKLLVGSDVPNPFIFHGLSAHEEMDEFVAAGVPVKDTIAAATSAPAEFFGQKGEWGVIAVGARADLVLLEANPLDDIANYRRINGTMVRGKWYDSTALQALLDATAEAFAEDENHGETLPKQGFVGHAH